MNARCIARPQFPPSVQRTAASRMARAAAYALAFCGVLSAGAAHAQTRLTQNCNPGWGTSVVVQVQNNSPLIALLTGVASQPESDPALYTRIWEPLRAKTYTFGNSKGISLDFPVSQDMDEIKASLQSDPLFQTPDVLSVSTDGPFVCFAVLPTLPGVALTEFYNASLDHYVLAVGASEVAFVEEGHWGPGWAKTGETITARVSASACHGARYIQRFASERNQWPPSLFYTVKPDVCGFLRSHDLGWRYAADAFGAAAPVNGACSPAYPTPVYQLYNNQPDVNRVNHRYTTSQAIYNTMLDRGWVGEGVAFCV